MKITLPSLLYLLAPNDANMPIYQKTWFQIGLLVAAVLFLFILYLLRNKHLRSKLKKLKAEKKNLIGELASIEKSNRDFEELVQQKNLELEKANQEMERLSSIDSVTGIANYQRFLDFFRQEWARAARYSRTISLIIIEMDFVREYQEAYGLEMYNQSLRKIAKMLMEIIRRPGDIAARFNNGDFIIVLSETESKNVTDLAEMIRVGAEYLDIETTVSTISKHATISLGCATARPEPKSDSGALIKAAETALRQAQSNGGNRVHTIDPL